MLISILSEEFHRQFIKLEKGKELANNEIGQKYWIFVEHVVNMLKCNPQKGTMEEMQKIFDLVFIAVKHCRQPAPISLYDVFDVLGPDAVQSFIEKEGCKLNREKRYARNRIVGMATFHMCETSNARTEN